MKEEVREKFRACHEEMAASPGRYSNRATLGPAAVCVGTEIGY